MSAGRRRAGRRHAQGGFTLVELLIGLVLGAIFALALYGFFDTSLTSAGTQRDQATAQADGRRAMDVMTRDIRQAVSPDAGVTPPIVALTPTTLVLYVDESRAPGNAATKPWRVRYQIVNGALTRETDDPVGSAPPYVYGGYGPAETLVPNVRNGAAAMFTATDADGAALAASLTPPATADVAGVGIRLVIGYRTGYANSTLELTTDVAPRNPRTPL